MVSLSSSITMMKTQFVSGSSLKQMDPCFLKVSFNELSPGSSVRGKAKLKTCNTPLIVRAGGDGGRPSSASAFVGGFALGGLIVGALGCVYAPQISKALTVAGADSKDLMRKLPKFIYDEEKALEKTRKILTEKIQQLNYAIDDVSAQLRVDEDEPAVSLDEVEASV